MDDQGNAARIGGGVTATPAERTAGTAPAEGRLHLELEVVRKRLDLVPARTVAVDRAQADLGEVREEDLIQVDEHALAGGVDGDDGQGHQDRVGVVELDGFFEGRARGGLVVNVAPDELDPVADALEDQHPLVEQVDRVAGHGESLGDGDRRQHRLLELVRPDLGVEVIVLAIERIESVQLLGVLGDLVEVAELLFGAARPLVASALGLLDDRLDIQPGRRLGRLRPQSGGGHAQSDDQPRSDGKPATHAVLPLSEMQRLVSGRAPTRSESRSLPSSPAAALISRGHGRNSDYTGCVDYMG